MNQHEPPPLLLAKIALVVSVAVVGGGVRLLLRLLALLGFRGARLGWLAATLLGVWWAAPTVGAGPAARLAVIGWAAWAARHHRAAIRVRVHPATRRLAAALHRQADALAASRTMQAAADARPPRPRPARPPLRRRDGVAAAPWPAAGQSAEQSLAAVGRHAAAWVARHLPPAGDRQPPRPPWRHPR